MNLTDAITILALVALFQLATKRPVLAISIFIGICAYPYIR